LRATIARNYARMATSITLASQLLGKDTAE
jgi:hypothetical protein